MKLYSLEFPIKGKNEGGFKPIEAHIPFSFIPYVFGRGNYPLLETIAGKYFKYYQVASKDERSELTLLVPKVKPIDEKSIKGAISDTIYQDKMIETDIIDAISSLKFTFDSGHWWLRYGLPLLGLSLIAALGYAYGSWLDILLYLYLLKGREFFVAKSLKKQFSDYSEKVKVGIRKAYKEIVNIRQIEHPGLRELKEGIEKTPNKTEGYIWALHSTGKLGFPELKSFYSWNSAMEEWEHEEIGKNFDVFEKPPVEYKEKLRRTTYKPTGIGRQLTEIIFNKGDYENE